MRLSLDAGEHDEEPEELWALFDVLHIACGGHAGDATSMGRVVAFCARREPPIIVGAHPSYPDRAGFGRRTIAIGTAALATAVTEQCAALAAIARAHGLAVTSVKAHGALYHDATASEPIARAVIRGAIDALGSEISMTGAPRGALHDVAAELGVRYLREGFADRAMRADGTLVPRTDPGALLLEPALAAAQARRLASEVETICVHADTPGAFAIARAVREAVHG